jgi:beta-carotene 3-hydroxylase
MKNWLIVIGTFAAMEAVTWLVHKYVMHGFLWNWHEDHHNKNHQVFLEKNDYFFSVFAVPSIALIALGIYVPDYGDCFYVGLGITLYGLAYFLVHEIFIHQRIKMFSRSKNFYFQALRKAHKVHHKHLQKEEGECFGMLWVPLKYFKEAYKANRK